jgi:hypothetical protein
MATPATPAFTAGFGVGLGGILGRVKNRERSMRPILPRQAPGRMPAPGRLLKRVFRQPH